MNVHFFSLQSSVLLHWGLKMLFPCLFVCFQDSFSTFFLSSQRMKPLSYVFWHFQKIPHVISNSKGSNLHPNRHSVKLTRVLSFVLWGKNKFKKEETNPTASSSPHSPVHIFSDKLGAVLPEQAETPNRGDSPLRGLAVIRRGPNPPKLFTGGGNWGIPDPLLFSQGGSHQALMFLECTQYCSSSSTFAGITVSALFRNCPIC